MSVIHININSILAKGDKILSFTASLVYKFDVICMSETYLKQNEKDDYYFPNYIFFTPEDQIELALCKDLYC